MEETEFEELCLIDYGIKSLRSVALHSHLQVLNLHCNEITKIENLEGLHNLKHLDLSSNQISEISGLDYLVNLHTLNLSCNVIKTVQGLENLRALVKLNLSYNQIGNISGLKAVDGPGYKLRHVELQGNCLVSVDHVGRCLEAASNLRQLILSRAGAENPCCNQQGYRDKLLHMLPQIHALDDVDRHGNPARDKDILSDIPVLEQYMEYFLSNNSQDINGVDVITPKIDAALEAFRQRALTASALTSSTDQDDVQEGQQVAAPAVTKQTQWAAFLRKKNKSLSAVDPSQLGKLESQLINLLCSSKDFTLESSTTEDQVNNPATETESRRLKTNIAKKRLPKRDTDLTEDSDDGGSSSSASKETRPGKLGQRSRPTGKGSKVMRPVQRTDKGKPSAKRSGGGEKLLVRGRSPNSPSRRQDGCRRRDEGGKAKPFASDEQMRDSVEETYLQIMKELETERERRWKAEQAAKRLVEHVKHLETKAREDDTLQNTAVQATSSLKQALTNERETCVKLRSEMEKLKEQVRQLTSDLDEVRKSEEETRRALRVAQETAVNAEKEQLRKQAHEAKKLQEATLKAAAAARELEILQNHVRALKTQVQQLQELLAAREQEHRRELEGRYTVDSPQLQELIQKEVRSREQVLLKQIEEEKQRYNQISTDYRNLEDEFRMALQIESNRFQELQTAYEKVSQELAQTKQSLAALQQKDEKSTAIISELTSLVKEQKGRLTELSKIKQEQQREYKERVQELEAHLEEARKRMVTLELLKQEKRKLQSQIEAQLSLIEGLRAEKKVWGDELVHQESGLAQDRGRLEAKIEALQSEVNTLKKQLQHETDTVRIKAKMIDDQTETIRKLKDALLERDEQIKQAREEALKVQKELEEQLSAELMANQELQEKLDRARERKEQLKAELAQLEDELEESKKAHSALNKKWKEKSSLIAQLEQQVMAMKKTWEDKEKRLTEERDKAVRAATLAVEKLRSVDDAFRKQLESKEESHQRALEALAREKEQEIELANKRVLEVEEEMRQLLRETELNKRLMEEKMRKLTRAFSEIQQDIL